MTWYIIRNNGYWAVQGNYKQARELADRYLAGWVSLSNFLDPVVQKDLINYGEVFDLREIMGETAIERGTRIHSEIERRKGGKQV